MSHDRDASWTQYDLSHFRATTGTDLFDVHRHFARWSEASRPAGYDLYLQALQSPPDHRVRVAGCEASLINFASYNYLGLANHPDVLAAAANALQSYGLGAAGSPHLSGLFDLHEELASELASFKQVDAVLLFPSGYAANLGVISALVGPDDAVIADMNAHASIVDGCVLARANLSLFRHNDLRSLERRLKHSSQRTLVIVEGVYSMDGDIAPLDEIASLCRTHGARLMVDEAHSAFVFGEHGRGLVEQFGVEDQVDVHFGTLSKSLGGMGGYVGGSRELIDYLRAYARSQVFSCGLAPAVVGGLRASLRIAASEPERRTRLWNNVAIVRDALLREGVDIGDAASQVLPIMVRDDTRIFEIARALEAAGVYLNPILYPAVKRQQSRFRVSVTSSHTEDELVQGAEIIGRVLREHGIVP